MSQIVNIAKYLHVNQPREGVMQSSGVCQRKAVCDIINDHAEYKHGGFVLFVQDLPAEEKQILLSYTVNLDDYIWLTENPVRLNAAFTVYQREMQDLIELYIDDCWHEAMQKPEEA